MFCSTFISNRLAKQLKLAQLREIDMEVSPFLNTEEFNKKLSEYEIVVKSVCNLLLANQALTVSKPSTFGQC